MNPLIQQVCQEVVAEHSKLTQQVIRRRSFSKKTAVWEALVILRKFFPWRLAVLLVIVTSLCWAESCPYSETCPLDGAQSYRVNTEYQGLVAIGVYEHTTTTMQVHRFRVRCN